MIKPCYLGLVAGLVALSACAPQGQVGDPPSSAEPVGIGPPADGQVPISATSRPAQCTLPVGVRALGDTASVEVRPIARWKIFTRNPLLTAAGHHFQVSRKGVHGIVPIRMEVPPGDATMRLSITAATDGSLDFREPSNLSIDLSRCFGPGDVPDSLHVLQTRASGVTHVLLPTNRNYRSQRRIDVRVDGLSDFLISLP